MTRDLPATILVVDDERALADTLTLILQRAGYHSAAAYSAVHAMQLLKTLAPALIISDIMMPETNGLDFAMQAQSLYPETKILLVSGHAGSQDLIESRAREFSFSLMAKPVAPKELLEAVAELLHKDSNRTRCS